MRIVLQTAQLEKEMCHLAPNLIIQKDCVEFNFRYGKKGKNKVFITMPFTELRAINQGIKVLIGQALEKELKDRLDSGKPDLKRIESILRVEKETT